MYVSNKQKPNHDRWTLSCKCNQDANQLLQRNIFWRKLLKKKNRMSCSLPLKKGGRADEEDKGLNIILAGCSSELIRRNSKDSDMIAEMDPYSERKWQAWMRNKITSSWIIEGITHSTCGIKVWLRTSDACFSNLVWIQFRKFRNLEFWKFWIKSKESLAQIRRGVNSFKCFCISRTHRMCTLGLLSQWENEQM